MKGSVRDMTIQFKDYTIHINHPATFQVYTHDNFISLIGEHGQTLVFSLDSHDKITYRSNMTPPVAVSVEQKIITITA